MEIPFIEITTFLQLTSSYYQPSDLVSLVFDTIRTNVVGVLATLKSTLLLSSFL